LRTEATIIRVQIDQHSPISITCSPHCAPSYNDSFITPWMSAGTAVELLLAELELPPLQPAIANAASSTVINTRCAIPRIKDYSFGALRNGSSVLPSRIPDPLKISSTGVRDLCTVSRKAALPSRAACQARVERNAGPACKWSHPAGFPASLNS